LGDGTYFPNAEARNFRVFDDSAPDRWGQTLVKRREALAAKDENRKPKTLYAWDFLLDVEDVSRQGALRFHRPDDEAFLAHDTLTVPPVASLKEVATARGGEHVLVVLRLKNGHWVPVRSLSRRKLRTCDVASR
jgi:serine/threonine-protein kinase HipA